MLQYELELHALRQQLTTMQSALDDTRRRLLQEQMSRTQLNNDWQQKMKKSEERQRQREREMDAERSRLLARFVTSSQSVEFLFISRSDIKLSRQICNKAWNETQCIYLLYSS